MTKYLLFLSIVFTALPRYILSFTQYCGSIRPSETGGAVGYVALQIAEGVAKYAFTLDLSNFQPSQPCNYNEGLNFHIHSYWTNTLQNSSSNANCGSSFTGGHYDPNFACSSSSQSYSTSCTALGRVSPTYTYSCNSTNYVAGKYSMCEVGDISGKHGVVIPNKQNISTLIEFNDFLPAYEYNFERADTTSLVWTSFVFHCKSPNIRIICTKFSTTDLEPCRSSFENFNKLFPTKRPTTMPTSSDDGDDSDDDHVYSSTDMAAAVVVCLIVPVLLLSLAFYFCYYRTTYSGGDGEMALKGGFGASEANASSARGDSERSTQGEFIGNPMELSDVE